MSNRNVAAETLRNARALIEDPASWTQGELARDECGRRVHHHSSEVSCRCALGATYAAAGREIWDPPGVMYLYEAAARLFCMSVAEVNDKRGHEAVLQMFDLAIEIAEGRA